MSTTRGVRLLIAAVALAIAIVPSTAGAVGLVQSFNTTLQPGVWHGFVIAPSLTNAGYVAEISPIGGGTNGETIERYVIQPEFNGTQWNDVVRMQISAGYAPLPVQVRVYDMGGMLPAQHFTTTLQPGVWHGFGLGPSSQDGGFLAEITPLGSGTDGETIERYVVQPEYNGSTWNDVLRMQVGAGQSPLDVEVHVYGTSGLPVVADITTTLQPGVWHGYVLGPSSAAGGYLTEITPLAPGTDGETIERYVVQPEYNGSTWNDVLRVQLPASYAPLQVRLKVYSVSAQATVATHSTWGRLKAIYR
ncbi:MAG TPA: hypothetical protein VJY35_15480 [Candidatus Eisenbacteria bacterium]|nr:hypothetical protein [Candidatus Eisenbacteria bacterium]